MFKIRLGELSVRVFLVFVIFLSSCSPESPPAPIDVRLVGGTELLQALVKTYNGAIPGFAFSSTVQRPGAIGAVDTLETGMGEVAVTGAGVGYTAFAKGTDDVPFPHKTLRGLAVLSVSALHLVTRPGLHFEQLTDLRGKRIAIGPQGSNTEVTARKFLPQFGIVESNLETPPFQEIPQRLADHSLDAHLFVRGYPVLAIETDLAVPGTHLVSIRGPEVLNLREKYPYLRPIVIPAGTYTGQCNPNVQQNAALPISTCDPNKLMQIEFVGPNTANPGKRVQPLDQNNFGPAIGFAWNLPWFGEGKTTVRGGYQLTYNGANRDLISSEGILGGAPGATNAATTNTGDANIAAILATRALNLTDIPTLVPVRATIAPGQTLPIYSRYAGAFEAYDPDYRTPYTQNLTLQVTRSLSSKMTVDVRYVGTLGRKMETQLNVNTPAIFNNPELVNALEVTRAGGNAPLFDQMFAGLNLSGVTTGGYGAVGTCTTGAPSGAPGFGQEGCAANQVMQHGSAHLRRNATFTQFFANGNWFNVINALGNLNTVTSGLQPLPTGFTGASARVLRNGCDRLGNNLYNAAAPASPTNIPTRCFPEDYFYANPQFAGTNPVYHANLGHNNYHSLQTQFTLRPTQGTSLQSTYTWQKNLRDNWTTYSDPSNRSADYTLDYTSIGTEFRTNGTFELPVGPNRLLFPNASGWVARAIERWQVSIIYQWSGGTPRDAYANQFLYAATGSSPQPRPLPNIVGPWVTPKTDFQWNGPNNNSGTIFGSPNPYVAYKDPQCLNNVGALDSMGFNLQTSCTLNGLAAIAPAGTPGAVLQSDGVTYAIPLLENPLPGHQGNFRPRALRAPGRWTLDGNIGKSFRITESKTLQVRFDATNILNHPNPGEPTFNMQSNSFGAVTADKSASARQFQGQLRLSF